ncbi:MAG TPA: bacteriohemerythrin [Anaerolineales bacterium]|jgi:hemerythrin-like metal-binding protein
MPILTWSDSYSVDDPAIDLQHKKLIDLINNLHDHIYDGGEIIGKTLDALIVFARDHFVLEENLMAQMNFPGLKAHQEEHDFFVGKIFEMQTDYREGKIAMSQPMLEFLEEWPLKHICTMDGEYAKFRKLWAEFNRYD